jgi:predicted metalloprotease with PDZ domain
MMLFIRTIQVIFIFSIFSFVIISCGYGNLVEYSVTFDNRQHHEAMISVVFHDVAPGPFTVSISRTSPGRYAAHSFAKNIYSLRAFDSEGKELAVDGINDYQWVIEEGGKDITVQYILYGNQLDGTYNSITDDYIVLNIPASFIWSDRYMDATHTLSLAVPDKTWKVISQMETSGDENILSAPDLAFFMDSPVALGDYDIRTWEGGPPGNRQQFNLAVLHNATGRDVDRFVDMIIPVFEEQYAFFGEYPAYDFGRYTIIANYLPHAEVDGMEHRNSTLVTRYNSLSNYKLKFLMTISHEFFHAWNMERLRPASLEPYNMVDPTPCEELWLAEGANEYYDDIFLVRAGQKSFNAFTWGLNLHINSVLQSSVYDYFSAVQIGERAALFDGAVFADGYNDSMYVTHYHLGDIVCLGLDLSLRSRYQSISLDSLMNKLWDDYGRDEIPYTNDNVKAALAEVAGDHEFAESFFTKHIYGREPIDYKTLLAHAGLHYTRRWDSKPSLGPVEVWSSSGMALLKSSPPYHSPLYKAGLDKGDHIYQIAGRAVTGRASYDSRVARLRPGDEVSIGYFQNGIRKSSTVTVDRDEEVKIIPYESAGLPVTDKIREFRESWIGSKFTGY